MMNEVYDIFISYRNDGEGVNFAARLKGDLSKTGYTVYYNEHDKSSGKFPDILKTAIEGCNDFILILSSNCLERLMRNEKIDWVREEIKYAKKFNKNIVPVLIGKAEMPSDKKDLPKGIRFIADMKAVILPIEYMNAPFDNLISMVRSKPSLGRYKDAANLNEKYNANEDFNITLKKARNNDSKAMYDIAFMYLLEHFSESNDDYYERYLTASEFLKKVIDVYKGQDCVPDYVLNAEIMLGMQYFKGCVLGEEQSFVKTLELLKQAKMKSEKSEFRFEVEFEKIINMELDGIGHPFNFKKTLEGIKAIQETGSDNVKFRIGKFYMRYGLYSEAVNILEKIEIMWPEVEYALAEIYLYGLHTPEFEPDVFKAQYYLKRAADSNHKESIHRLGLLYFRGQFGFEKNFEKARLYYKRAAELGDIDALYDYANALKYGWGGERNIIEACKYHLYAAEKGHILSMSELARIYQSKECRDYERAYEWALKGSGWGNVTCEFILGNLLFFGRGCSPNHHEALKYYRRALNHGFYPAKFMIEKINKIYNLE